MSNFLNRFYFLSKLTTSLVLLSIVIFLIFLFFKAFFLNDNNNLIADIREQVSILSKEVEKNNQNLEIIETTLLNYKTSIKDMSKEVKEIKNDKSLLTKLDDIVASNKKFKNDIQDMILGIESLDNKDLVSTNKEKNNIQIESLVQLIKLKIDNGSNTVKEVNLLENFELEKSEKKPYLEKIQILSNQNFIGLKKLSENFDANVSNYLNKNYILENDNSFIKYFSNFIKIEPNLNSSVKDKNIRNFILAKTNISEKNLELALINLKSIEGIELFFSDWILEAGYYIEFNKNLDKIIE